MHKTYHYTELEPALTTLNAILDVIEEGVWDWCSDTRTVTRSPGWYRMLGYDINSLKGDVHTWEKIIHPDDYARVMEHFENYTTGKSSEYKVEYRCLTANKDYIWVTDSTKIIAYNADGTVARMIGAHNNIDQQKKAQIQLEQQNNLLQADQLTLEVIIQEKTKELATKNKLLESKFLEVEYLSNTDQLTSIANRKKFEEALSKEISRAKRYHQPLSMVLFDIDLFKEINDQYGHKVGDEILINLSQLINQNIREEDLLARWGGDEFVIIFPNLTLVEAINACEKLRNLVHENTLVDGVATSCSFGVAQYNPQENDEAFFQQVDRSLYLSKDKGRNRVESLG